MGKIEKHTLNVTYVLFSQNKAEIFGFLKPSTEGNLFTAPNAKINVPDQRELWCSTRTYPR